MIDLRHFRYFQAVAQELHFGRPRPACASRSRRCRARSSSWKGKSATPLLRRTQRRVELLPAGQLFLERSNLILEEVERAAIDARRTGAGECGRLSVGFIHSATYGLLPSIIERFRHLYPDIELELHEMPITEQHVALTRGVIDVGVLRPQPAPSEVQVQAVLEDPFLVAVPHKHRLARRKAVRLKELEGEPMVMFPRRGSPLFHSRIVAMCERAGFTPRGGAASHPDPYGGRAGRGRHRAGDHPRDGAQPAAAGRSLPRDRRRARAGARGAGMAAVQGRHAGGPLVPAGHLAGHAAARCGPARDAGAARGLRVSCAGNRPLRFV
jgi:DNA-binding transcriptional LysR family regulator